MHIENLEQNDRLDSIENSMNKTAEVFEVIDDEFKELKKTDDLIKEDLIRKSFAKSSTILSVDVDLNHSQRQTRLSIENVEQNGRHDRTEERLDFIEEVIENFEDIPGNITNDLEYLEVESDRNILI